MRKDNSVEPGFPNIVVKPSCLRSSYVASWTLEVMVFSFCL